MMKCHGGQNEVFFLCDVFLCGVQLMGGAAGARGWSARGENPRPRTPGPKFVELILGCWGDRRDKRRFPRAAVVKGYNPKGQSP